MAAEDCKGFYTRHIFFCERSRVSGDACAAVGGVKGYERCAAKVRELGLDEHGLVWVNRSGCLDRCAEGPVAVVYPEAVWYTFVDALDIDEIVESHLQHGRVVERLRLSKSG